MSQLQLIFNQDQVPITQWIRRANNVQLLQKLVRVREVIWEIWVRMLQVTNSTK
jgi:hypothetical protein